MWQLEIVAHDVADFGGQGFGLEEAFGLALDVLGGLPGLPRVGQVLRFAALLAFAPAQARLAVGAWGVGVGWVVGAWGGLGSVGLGVVEALPVALPL